jgi:hypothetical protein
MGLLIAAVTILVTGCSEDAKPTDDNLSTTTPKIERVTPAEGNTDAALKPIIGIKFDMSMDTTSFMRNFHFTAHPDLPDWMDSLQHHSGMMAGGMMNMGHMMDWLDSIEYLGDFDWNDRLDSCTFVADSTLMPNTDCMLYIYGDVRGRNGMMMEMNSYRYGGAMTHFRTRP